MTNGSGFAVTALQERDAATVRFSAATMGDMDAIMDIERAAYPLPWSCDSFTSILSRQGLQCGDYVVQLLWARPPVGTEAVQGYFVAMLGFEEMHLLNLAVHPDFQAKGCSLLLLQHLRNWAQGYGARALWLEVRESNRRAQEIYRRFGFLPVAMRKHYYPTPEGGREHAAVMQLLLPSPGGDTLRPV